jgi:Asp-tRNA(Asn)/Glu-tRNA(Gln) amidotransferase A subunit family amidase
MNEPFDLDATEAAARIAAGQLSPVDLVESLLDRIGALDGLVHAWARLDADTARRAAVLAASDANAGTLYGPLHGVPVGLKDIYLTAGLATEAGSPLYQGYVPDKDAATVARLRRAGAIILGKTETTQFAMGDAAPTRNPWNPEHTPGGSSSGSAAAVASRMVPAALGTQTAGSVLRPAAFCGVVGFKPTAGRFSLEGIFPLAWTLDHPGTISRSVRDARLLASVLDEVGDLPALRQSERPPRLGVLGGRFVERADGEALGNLDQAVQRLAAAGATLSEIRLPDDFDLVVDVHHIVMASEAAAYHLADHTGNPGAYRPNLRALIEVGSLVPAVAYLQAQRLRTELCGPVDRALRDLDCVIMPTALGTAPEGLSSTGDPAFNAPWSLFGVPSISIPCGVSGIGLPFGLQLVGPRMGDAAVLDAAEWCEGVLGPLPMPLAITQQN